MRATSKDTLLRVVRRRSRSPSDPLRVIGIDDWAWRRNHRYASIICNLERRRVVTLLPDRELATAQAWLAASVAVAPPLRLYLTRQTTGFAANFPGNQTPNISVDMANSKSAIKASESKVDVSLEFVGSSLEDLSAFPLPCKKEIGFALRAAQKGEKGENVKPLKGFWRS